MDVLTCLNLKIREIFLQGNPLYFVAINTVETAAETAAIIKKNREILEKKYVHCNIVF